MRMQLNMVRIWAALALGAAALVPDSAAAAADRCASLIARAEQREGIPRRLLRAISLAESGRHDRVRNALVSWPWTINVRGDGKFFATKSAAVKAVKKYRARGIHSIDVGCMQVNLMHHPKAFSSVEAAFEPKRNVAYAAAFLRRLREASGSWIQAIANYHSQDGDRGRRYMLRVLQIWVNQAPGKSGIRMAQRGTPGVHRSPAHERFMRSNTLFGRSHKQGRHAVRVVRGTPAGLQRSPSLFNRTRAVKRTRVVRGFEAKRKWAEIIQRRKRFAEWLAKRQAERRAGHDPS
jgi:hypothetical protein